MASGVEHIFVLALENRSFDHMLGFSAIHGQDAATGEPTEIRGVTDLSLLQLARSLQVNTASGFARQKELEWPLLETISLRDLFTANTFAGNTFRVSTGADLVMPADPPHELDDVVVQLCGNGATYPLYPPNGPYPQITNGGFVSNYATRGGLGNAAESAAASSNPGEIMKCYAPERLPVLVSLCKEFVVCDGWYASMPGPTWPNRFFMHAASSGGLDHSPDILKDIAKWDTVDGFRFAHGTIFDALNRADLKWRIYTGDPLPIVAALHGINLTDRRDFGDLAEDLADGNYDAAYTFIEPNYDIDSEFRTGNSQHPLADVTAGEALIKATYEAIRNSPVWSSSLLIITWDEHGGFFDHIAPPRAVPPGDTSSDDDNNEKPFTFDQYGPRVPAVVISPLIPKNLIDHRLYDHASIPATIEACFGLGSLTQRDATANNLMSLVSLGSPRLDTPTTLPAPLPPTHAPAPLALHPGAESSRPTEQSLNFGNCPGFLFVALRLELQASPAASKPEILNGFAALRTWGDARSYFERVGSLART